MPFSFVYSNSVLLFTLPAVFCLEPGLRGRDRLIMSTLCLCSGISLNLFSFGFRFSSQSPESRNGFVSFFCKRFLYFVVSKRQTKMWLSNLGKFRRVLIFDAEKVCVSERFSLIRRRKKVFSCVHKKQHIQFSNPIKLCHFM